MAGYKRSLTPEQFLRVLRALPNKLTTELKFAKREIETHSVNYFQAGFSRSGFGTGGDKWAKRIHSYSHPILYNNGDLKNSIGSTSVSSSYSIVVGATAPYAKYHNDPTGTWRRNQYTNASTTQRQFIGNSLVLEKWIQKRLQKALIETFK